MESRFQQTHNPFLLGRRVSLIAFWGGITAGLVYYLVAGLRSYHYLLAHQPPSDPNQPWPPDVTSFPPSAAWYYTLLPAVGIVVIATLLIFIGLFLYNLNRRRVRLP